MGRNLFKKKNIYFWSDVDILRIFDTIFFCDIIFVTFHSFPSTKNNVIVELKKSANNNHISLKKYLFLDDFVVSLIAFYAIFIH